MGLFTGVTDRFVFARFGGATAALLGLMVVANHAGGASGVGLPSNVCHDFCGPRQHQLWARFEQGHGLDLHRGALPRVYAGVCHVLGDNVNPEREHHVGFMIDGRNGHHQLHLRFSFFTDAQPYDALDAEQASASFGAPILPLSVHDGYAFAEVTGRRFFARYWLRRDRERERTLLVSYFGDRITILCDAAANRY